MRVGETPVHISNTMVKPYPAWDTALATVWESRWLPDFYEEKAVKRACVLESLLSYEIMTGIIEGEAFMRNPKDSECAQGFL